MSRPTDHLAQSFAAMATSLLLFAFLYFVDGLLVCLVTELLLGCKAVTGFPLHLWRECGPRHWHHVSCALLGQLLDLRFMSVSQEDQLLQYRLRYSLPLSSRRLPCVSLHQHFPTACGDGGISFHENSFNVDAARSLVVCSIQLRRRGLLSGRLGLCSLLKEARLAETLP